MAGFDDAGPSHQISMSRELCLEPKHKIFLSHSGAQKDFTEQLCKDLGRVHHFPFFDSLPKGEKFPSLILEAAKQCRVAILVLSEEFFTRSKWPMIELSEFVRVQESTNTNLKILPLFFGLRLSQLKDARMLEDWVKVWQNWANEDNRIDVKEWVHALSKILDGINAMEYNREEGHVTFRERVVAAVCKLVPPDVKWDVSHVYSMERLCKPILQKMKEVEKPHGIYGVRVVGLYGMGGIGKTTISKAYCNQMFGDFDGKVCHAELGADKNLLELRKNVLRELTEANEEILTNEAKLAELLKSRMHRQRVFLSLDNVWENQIEEAQMYLKAGYQDGSTVLVTSRSLGILVQRLHIPEHDCLEMPEFVEEDAIKLFVHHAAPRTTLKDTDWKTIRRCVRKCHFLKTGLGHMGRCNTDHYLPLALKVLGSQLRSISDDPCEWEGSLNKLKVDMFNLTKDKEHPVHTILRLGYDTLCLEEQLIFLDLALLVVPQWRYLTRESRIEYSVLEWLSVIHGKTKDDIKDSLKALWRRGLLDDVRDLDPLEVRIHDLYLDFAKEEAQAGPLERRRFLFHEKGSDVSPKVQNNPSGSCWSCLERLVINYSDLPNLKKANLHLCSNVKVLQLFHCGMLEEIDMQGIDRLISVEVIECHNIGKQFVKRVEKLRNLVMLRWTGIRNPAPVLRDLSSLTALQILHLEGRFYKSELIFPPNLSGCINLQKLTLSEHIKLKSFPDVSNLTNLKKIDFSGCHSASGHVALSNVSNLWWKIGFSKRWLTRRSLIDSMTLLTNLQELNLHCCLEVDDLTDLCELISLQKLIVSHTKISELPDLRKLKQLQVLDVRWCRSLRSLVGVAHATALRYLCASCCFQVRELPDRLSSLEDLEEVNLSYCDLVCTLPNGYKMLAGRGILKVRSCWGLIEFLVKELQWQVPRTSHDCVSTACVSSCEQSMWDRRKDNPAYDLLEDVFSESSGTYALWNSWSYMLNDGESVNFMVRALCEHDDMGSLSSVLADVRPTRDYWVVVVTAPCTFGVVTEKAMLTSRWTPSWDKTMLHSTISFLLPEFVQKSGDERRAGTWVVQGMVAVLHKCKEQLLEECIGIDPVRSVEGREVVDTFLREIEATSGQRISEDSILVAFGKVGEFSPYQPFDYNESFPNFPFGPTLAKQLISRR